MFGRYSYVLQKLTDILDTAGLDYETWPHPIFDDIGLVDDCCTVSFGDNVPYTLSVVTTPSVCMDAMCETALKRNGKVIYVPDLNYDDVLRHSIASHFENHLHFLIKSFSEKPNGYQEINYITRKPVVPQAGPVAADE